jgi:hypothetical protein
LRIEDLVGETCELAAPGRAGKRTKKKEGTADLLSFEETVLLPF